MRMNALAVGGARASKLTLAASAEPQALWHFVEGSGLRALVVGTSKVPNAKITVLLISQDTRRPELALKLPTTDAARTAVRAETAMLLELDRVAPDIMTTVPRVVGDVEFHGRRGVVMTAVHGTPMSTFYARNRHTANPPRVTADFAAVDRWLAALQRGTAAHLAPLEMDSGIGARLAQRFADDDRIEETVERLGEICGRLRSNLVPRTAVHGDLWISNVLLSEGAVSGVVDWEDGEPRGEPVRDLVRFAIAYALFLDRYTKAGRRVRGHPGLRVGTWGAGVEYALGGQGWFPDIVRGFLRVGLARLGADESLWRDAALAGIAELAALTDDPAFARPVLALFQRLESIGAPR
jgi:aminoglycoside phosphotransferase